MCHVVALILTLWVVLDQTFVCYADCTVQDVGPWYTGPSTGDIVPDGNNVAYSCASGYTSDGGNAVASCNGTTFTGPALRCTGCVAPALDSAMERSPTTPDSNIVANGTTMTYTCKLGYASSSVNQEITCNTNSWSSRVTLKCGCVAPTLPPTMNRNPTTAGGDIILDSGTLHYTCKTGYTANTAEQVRTCTGSTNTWTLNPQKLTCAGCAMPRLDSGMTRNADTPEGGIKVDGFKMVYKCKSGYTGSSDSQEVICDGRTNTWSKLKLTCSGCEVPTIDRDIEREPNTTKDGDIKADGETITYTCKYGPSLTKEATCIGATHEWSSHKPDCSRIAAAKTVTGGSSWIIVTLAILVFYF